MSTRYYPPIEAMSSHTLTDFLHIKKGQARNWMRRQSIPSRFTPVIAKTINEMSEDTYDKFLTHLLRVNRWRNDHEASL